jgi:RND family efflux transporter MFP subunit
VQRAKVLAALALVLAACGREKPAPEAQAKAPAPRAVRTVEAARTGGDEAMVPAIVQARQRATLAARIPASVAELPYREGGVVAAGAVVARLDDAALRAAVAAAEAAVKAAEADLARAESLLRKGAATPRENEEAAARAAAARAQLSAARDNLSYAVLRAPFAGRVSARPVNVGDVVNPGTPVVEIEGEGGLEVLSTVEAASAVLVKPGLVVKAFVDGQAEPLAGTVRSVSPAGDPTTHRFEVKADLPPARGLRSGLFARLALPAVPGPERITVPAGALLERGGLTGVFVVAEGRARLRWVAVGAREGDVVEVRAGLSAGERVVLEPGGLTDGAAVIDEGQRPASEAGFTPAPRAGGSEGAPQHPPAQ